MDFSQSSQNGVQPATLLKTITSNLGCAVSSTSTIYGKPMVIKAISNAAMYKTTQVSFYSDWNNGSTTTTVLLGTADFVDTTTAPLMLSNLQTGTHAIYVSWPGEGMYGPVTTQPKPVGVYVDPGDDLGGEFTITATPADDLLVEGEGTVVFEAVLTTSTYVGGNFLFFDNNVQIGSVPVFENAAQLEVSNLTAGEHTIKVTWTGASIGGYNYEGRSTEINYTVLRGTTVTAPFTLTPSKSSIVFEEGDVTLTAAISSSTVYPGTVSFYNGETYLGYSPLNNNSASWAVSTIPIGTSTYTAVWDGNQNSHPRYIEKTSTATVTVVERGIPPALSFSVAPNPTAFRANTTFRAEFSTSTQIPGNVRFIVGGEVVGSSTLTNNVAEFQTAALLPGTFFAFAQYTGNSTSPKYYSTVSSTATLVVSEGLDIGGTFANQVINTYRGYTNQYVAGDPILLRLSASTSTQLTDPAIWVENRQPLTTSSWVNNVATSTITYATTGSHSIYGLWNGGEVGAEFYAAKRSSVSTFDVVDAYTLEENITVEVSNDSYRGTSAPYITNEAQTLTAVLNTTGNFTGVVKFYKNGVEIGENTLSGNSSTSISHTFTSSGTYTLRADWQGGTGDTTHQFNPKTGTTSSISIVSAYTLDNDITIAARSNIDAVSTTIYRDDQIKLTASVNTSSQLSGPVTFYVDGISVGTSTFVNNSSTFTLTNFLTTGAKTVQAKWTSGTADGGRPYNNKDGLTATISVQAPNTFVTPALSISSVRVINEPITFTFNSPITTSDAAGLQVKFYDNGTLFTSTNLSSVGTATVTATIATTGSHAISAVLQPGWSNSHNYYSSTSATSSISVVAGQNFPGSLSIEFANTDMVGSGYMGAYEMTNVTKNTTLVKVFFNASTTTTNQFAGTTVRLVDQNSGATYATGTFTTSSNGATCISTLTVASETLTAGIYTLRAVWDGTNTVPKYLPITSSNNVVLTMVNPGATTMNFSLSTSTFYSYNADGTTSTSPVATVSLSGQYYFKPYGLINLYDGPTLLGSGNILSPNTSTTITWLPGVTQLDLGTRTLTAQYGGDNKWNSAVSASTNFTAYAKRSSTLTLTGVTGTQFKPNEFTLRATSSAGTYMNGKTVKLYKGNSQFASVASSGTTATFVVSTIGVAEGSDNWTARYDGDQAYNSVISNTQTISISKGTPSIALTLSPSTFRYYNSDLSTNSNTVATVSLGNYRAGYVPTGTISVYDVTTSTVLLGSGTANASGILSVTFKPSDYGMIDAGTRTLRAAINADSNYNTNSVNASFVAKTQAILPSFTLAASTSSLYEGQTLTWTATKTNSPDTNDTVTFVDTVRGVLTTATMTGNTSTYSVVANRTTSSYRVTATWSGDQYYESATSNQTVTTVLAKANLTITVSTPEFRYYNANGTINSTHYSDVTVTGYTFLPTGLITLKYAGVAIGTGYLSGSNTVRITWNTPTGIAGWNATVDNNSTASITPEIATDTYNNAKTGTATSFNVYKKASYTATLSQTSNATATKALSTTTEKVTATITTLYPGTLNLADTVNGTTTSMGTASVTSGTNSYTFNAPLFSGINRFSNVASTVTNYIKLTSHSVKATFSSTYFTDTVDYLTVEKISSGTTAKFFSSYGVGFDNTFLAPFHWGYPTYGYRDYTAYFPGVRDTIQLEVFHIDPSYSLTDLNAGNMGPYVGIPQGTWNTSTNRFEDGSGNAYSTYSKVNLKMPITISATSTSTYTHSWQNGSQTNTITITGNGRLVNATGVDLFKYVTRTTTQAVTNGTTIYLNSVDSIRAGDTVVIGGNTRSIVSVNTAGKRITIDAASTVGNGVSLTFTTSITDRIGFRVTYLGDTAYGISTATAVLLGNLYEGSLPGGYNPFWSQTTPPL